MRTVGTEIFDFHPRACSVFVTSYLARRIFADNLIARARSDKMETIPALSGDSFSEKSSLEQTDADHDRFVRK
jgi:hypothetical protein